MGYIGVITYLLTFLVTSWDIQVPSLKPSQISPENFMVGVNEGFLFGQIFGLFFRGKLAVSSKERTRTPHLMFMISQSWEWQDFSSSVKSLQGRVDQLP